MRPGRFFSWEIWEITVSVDLDALLDAAIERRAAEPVTETVEVLVGGDVWFLKFTELSGNDWADVCAVNPQRIGSPIDQRFGYDYDGAARSAAPMSGVRVDGDAEVALSDEQWAKLFKALSGRDFKAISNAVWGLNEIHPMTRLAQAKKALAGVPAKKQR